MNPTYNFEGQVALVTGASSGIGLAAAQGFAQAGASVVLADVNEQALQAAVDGLTSAGHVVLAVSCDVSDEEQVAATVERAVDRFGRDRRRRVVALQPRGQFRARCRASGRRWLDGALTGSR